VPVNLFELAGPMLVMAAFALALVHRQRLGVRVAAAICGAAAAFLPIGPTTPGLLLLGTAGPVSAATLVLVGNHAYGAIRHGSRRRRSSRALLVCLLVTGAAFYPLTFGLTSFDPYELGYRGAIVPALMLGYVVVGWLARAADILCWIALTALLYLLGAYDSNNFWDYLIFPTDPIYAAGALAVRALRAPTSPVQGECHSDQSPAARVPSNVSGGSDGR
jgi:hypothetical protein